MKRILIGAAALAALTACSPPDPTQQAVESYVEKVWTLVDECQDALTATETAMASGDIPASRAASMQGHATCKRVVGDLFNVSEPAIGNDPAIELFRRGRASFMTAQSANSEAMLLGWKALEDSEVSPRELERVQQVTAVARKTGLEAMQSWAFATTSLDLNSDRIGALMKRIESQ